MFEAPRRRDYPLPALTPTSPASCSTRRRSKLGYTRSRRRARSSRSPTTAGRPAPIAASARHSAATSARNRSILVTKLPEADATGNFKLITGAMCYRVNTDNSAARDRRVLLRARTAPTTRSRPTSSSSRPSSTTTRGCMLLSKTDKFPNGLANSSGHLGKHIMTHIRARVFLAFDDRHMNIFMGPSAQKHSIDDWNGDNFDHKDLGFIRGAQISVGPAALEGGPIGAATGMNPPPGVPRWGAAYRDFLAKYYTRHAVIAAQIEDLPYGAPDHRSRSRHARRLGPAGAAHDLRLAAAERARAHRVHRRQDGGDRPRHRRCACLAHARRPARPAATMKAAPAWAAIRRTRS